MRKIIFFVLPMLLMNTVSADVQDDFERIMQTIPEKAHIKAELSMETPDGIFTAYYDSIVNIGDKKIKVYTDVLQDGEEAVMWADIDMSVNCKFYVAVKNPSAGNYITFDCARLPVVKQIMMIETAEPKMVVFEDNKYVLSEGVYGKNLMTAETDETGKCIGIEFENEILSLSCEISEADEETEIVFPEITDENSADVTAMLVDGLSVSEINLLYNDSLVEFEERPILENGRTYLPLRKLANTFGISDENISFDGENREVTVKYGEYVMLLTIGSNKAYINGTEKEFDAPAFIRYDRTYLPLRFIAESFGKEVDWLPIENVTGEKLSGSLIIMTDK